MNKEQQTKEDRIIENLDRGESVVAALAGVGADSTDVALYETLANMKDTTTPVPPRENFAQLLQTLPVGSVPSPYKSVRSPFAQVRLLVPALLGLLIIVSGIGIETGRITIVGQHYPTTSVSKEQKQTTLVATRVEPDTAGATLSALRETEPATSAAVSGDAVVEDDYDTFFEEESIAFMSIADAYEVTI